jgi:hypothetical protein
MQLRNGKHTSEIARMHENRARTKTNTILGYNMTIQDVERILIADGYQTSTNMRDLKKAFGQTDSQYLKMLKGLTRTYGYKYKI